MSMNSPRKVRDLDDKLTFINKGADINFFREHIINGEKYDSFFVYIEDQALLQLWGIKGTVPLLDKEATRLIPLDNFVN